MSKVIHYSFVFCLNHVASPGTLPNITRNALVNCTELVTYDLIKEAILKHKLLSGESLTHTHTHRIDNKLKLIGQRATHPLAPLTLVSIPI